MDSAIPPVTDKKPELKLVEKKGIAELGSSMLKV